MSIRLRIFLTGTTICFSLIGVFGNEKVTAAGFLFNRTLSVGSSGEDVRELQKILNSDVNTQITDAGPGSPGLETRYFGSLTRAAVIRFQEKYSGDILVPNGLSVGTGFVGRSTLGVLNKLGQEVVIQKSSNIINPVSTNYLTPNHSTQSQNVTQNPNQKNLDLFLSEIEKISIKKGLSADKISHMKEVIIADVATSTNLMNAFEQVVRGKVSYIPPSYRNTLAKIVKSFQVSIFPKNVNAQAITPKIMADSPGLPFGGEILFSYYCSCSQNWLIYIKPAISPTMPTMLSYQTGSQAYLNFNLPFALLILGNYEPGAGYCTSEPEAYCGVNLPSQGLITPTVGSF